jgi:hypothetical protein
MIVDNFVVRRLTAAERELAKSLWGNEDFVPTDDYWLATFEVDGVRREAGIRAGKRADVGKNHPLMADVQLRVNESEFDADKFISESQVAEVTKLVGEKFESGRYWEEPKSE